jgi:anti-sigma factor RsiW
MDESVRELIDRYVDGETTPEESARVRDTLSGNPEAKAYGEEAARLVGLLNAIPAPAPPADLKHHVMSSIHVEHRRVVKARKWYAPIWKPWNRPGSGRIRVQGAALGLFAAWLAGGDRPVRSRLQRGGDHGSRRPQPHRRDRWETEFQGRAAVEINGPGSPWRRCGAGNGHHHPRSRPARVRPLGTSRGRGPGRVEVEGGWCSPSPETATQWFSSSPGAPRAR